MTSFLDNIVSHGPKPKVLTKDQAARSVVVKNIPPDATAVDVFIHFQQQKNTVKNGGGEIDHVHIPEKGTAVITFESSEGLSVDLTVCDLLFERSLYRGIFQCTGLGFCQSFLSTSGFTVIGGYKTRNWTYNRISTQLFNALHLLS